jgi:hypothetical protein
MGNIKFKSFPVTLPQFVILEIESTKKKVLVKARPFMGALFCLIDSRSGSIASAGRYATGCGKSILIVQFYGPKTAGPSTAHCDWLSQSQRFARDDRRFGDRRRG